MNNQHFGDINDFYKYAILRILQEKGESKKTKLFVVWMMTNEDNLGYLRDENSDLRNLDEKLFNFLKENLINEKRKLDISLIENSNLLPRDCFFESSIKLGKEPRKLGKEVPSKNKRKDWLNEILEKANGKEIVFLDPDTGIEPPRAKLSKKGIRWKEYILWEELRQLWQNGHSFLIYQHSTRGKKSEFKRRLKNGFKKEVFQKTGRNPLFIKLIKGQIKKPTAYFILVAQEKHKWLETAIENIRDKLKVKVIDLM
jgi:hypothetical protein